ncbi:ABC transporter permease [Demetria terragena]|uniref:ABC transporter permease n=1 Tax=Demetria terragena TaxID=63959 RepID=UPI000361BAF1|nr:ABC transporter permease [Demetria terragena]
MTIEPSWRVGLALAILLCLGLLVHRRAHTGLARDALVASLRAIAQLSFAALVIAVALEYLWSSLLVIAVMFAMAAVTTTRRIGVPLGSAGWSAFALGCGLLPVLAVLLISGAVPLKGIALIPVTGILLGNTMTAHTLFGRRAFAALTEERGAYEAMLALGMPPDAAVTEVIHRYLPEGLVAGLDQIRTAGVVTLPGAFIGVMLGGGSPVQAATAQVLVLLGLQLAQSVAVVAQARLIASRRVLTARLRADLAT